jgi:hypothetical protein
MVVAVSWSQNVQPTLTPGKSTLHISGAIDRLTSVENWIGLNSGGL